jgi:hypothetical protein
MDLWSDHTDLVEFSPITLGDLDEMMHDWSDSESSLFCSDDRLVLEYSRYEISYDTLSVSFIFSVEVEMFLDSVAHGGEII